MEPHALKRVKLGPRDNDILMKTNISVQRAVLTLMKSFLTGLRKDGRLSLINGTGLAGSPNFNMELGSPSRSIASRARRPNR